MLLPVNQIFFTKNLTSNRWPAILFICIFITACSTGKEVDNSHDPADQSKMAEINDPKPLETPVYSALTRMFVKHYYEALQNANEEGRDVEISDFPDRMTENHNIRIHNGQVFITGMMKTNYDFSKNQINELGVEIRSTIGDIHTVNLPANALFSLYKIEGIEYFEIDQKMQLH